ncbi:MAG: InlB B-repeat-containing protein, partial [Oscillospiraceae bacterium]
GNYSGDDIGTAFSLDELVWTEATLADAIDVANTNHSNKTVYIQLTQDVTNVGEELGREICFGRSNYDYVYGSIIFDLNGHTVDRGLTQAYDYVGSSNYRNCSSGNCIVAQYLYDKFTITSTAAGRGTVTGGYLGASHDGGSGIYIYCVNNSVTLSNINVTGNNSSTSTGNGGGYGTAVEVYCKNSVILENVTVSGNSYNGTHENQSTGVSISGSQSVVFKGKITIYDANDVMDGLYTQENTSIAGMTDDSLIRLSPLSIYIKTVQISTDGQDKKSCFKTIDNTEWIVRNDYNNGLSQTEEYYEFTYDMQGKRNNYFYLVRSDYTLDDLEPDPDEEYEYDYVFEGWYKDKNCTQKFDFDTSVTENTTIYANWIYLKKLDEVSVISSTPDLSKALTYGGDFPELELSAVCIDEYGKTLNIVNDEENDEEYFWTCWYKPDWGRIDSDEKAAYGEYWFYVEIEIPFGYSFKDDENVKIPAGWVLDYVSDDCIGLYKVIEVKPDYDVTTDDIKNSGNVIIIDDETYHYMDLKPGTRIYDKSNLLYRGDFYALTYEMAVDWDYIDAGENTIKEEYYYNYEDSISESNSVITLKPE